MAPPDPPPRRSSVATEIAPRCSAWLDQLAGASFERAVEALGRELRPRRVLVLGHAGWDILDFLVGIESVETIQIFTSLSNPSLVTTGWADEDDVLRRRLTRPSRAVTLHPKISWHRLDGDGFPFTCDFLVVSQQYFVFELKTYDCIGLLIHATAADAYLTTDSWTHADFPPKDFFDIRLVRGHCGYHPVRVPDKSFFNRHCLSDYAGARRARRRKVAPPHNP